MVTRTRWRWRRRIRCSSSHAQVEDLLLYYRTGLFCRTHHSIIWSPISSSSTSYPGLPIVIPPAMRIKRNGSSHSRHEPANPHLPLFKFHSTNVLCSSWSDIDKVKWFNLLNCTEWTDNVYSFIRLLLYHPRNNRPHQEWSLQLDDVIWLEPEITPRTTQSEREGSQSLTGKGGCYIHRRKRSGWFYIVKSVASGGSGI